jgi:hypothetical protein
MEARYGKPLQVHGDVVTYNFQRFHVVVTFLNGQSQSELYYRSDNKYLVPIEVGKLMEMNSRENYTWYPAERMFALIPRWPGFPNETNAKKQGPPDRDCRSVSRYSQPLELSHLHGRVRQKIRQYSF